MPNKQCRDGFTLIEFLVVLGILVVVVGASLLFLASILRGSNQATIIAEVKQNGQVVFDILDSQIRNSLNATQATEFPVVEGRIAADHLILKRSTGLLLHLACWPSLPDKNGWIGTSEDSSNNPTNYASLTERDAITGVDVSECDLRVLPPSVGALGPPIVSVSFTVNQGVKAPSREDFKADARFQTTISLRSYAP